MSNLKELKQQNLLEVIRLLRQNTSLNKQSLAKLMGLSTVSAHSFINELVDMNMVLNTGFSSVNSGRKASLFHLNPNYGFVVGIYLSSRKLYTVSYNFASELLSSFSLNIETIPASELIDQILSQINLAISSHEGQYGKCLGIGLSLPAIIDNTSGMIRKIFHIQDFTASDLKFVIQDTLHLPVFIGNDIQMCMNSIKWSENIFTDSPIAFVGIDDGVGASLLIGGKILRGANSAVTEIGHISVDLNGPLCKCGNRGCIENYISEKKLLEKVISHLNETMGTAAYTTRTFTIKHLIALAEYDDFVQNLLAECCDYIYILLENMVKLYGPREIIIECEYLKQLPAYFEYLCSKFDSSPWVINQNYSIRLNQIENIYPTGAAMTVLDNLYTASSDNILLNIIENYLNQKNNNTNKDGNET